MKQNEKNMKYTAEQIQNKFNSLPKSLQRAILSAQVEEKMIVIAKKHGLHFDQTDALIDESRLVMLGLKSSKNYVENIQKAVEISEQKAVEIAHDIDEQIFKEVKEYLMTESVLQKDMLIESFEKEGELHPSREEILAEVEDRPIPSSDKASWIRVKQEASDEKWQDTQSKQNEQKQNEVKTNDIMEEKLGGTFKIPSEESKRNIKEKNEKQMNKIDPYREPIE